VSGIEFIPGKELDFEPIPRKHIQLEKKIITTYQLGTEGIDYSKISNVWVVGKKKDFGLLLKVAPYGIWKRGSIADWSQYIEIFGQPVRIVRYDAYDEKTQRDAKKALDESGSSLALLLPKQADFEMLDGKGSNANGDLQDKFRIACNEEMSVAILGNTETTMSSKSSGYAQSKEHGEQQDEIIFDDMKFLKSHLNSTQFLSILESYGYPVTGGKFTFKDDIDLAKLKTRLEIDEKLAIKVPVSDEYWYETYHLPKPANYNELKNSSKYQVESIKIEEEEEEKIKETRDKRLETKDDSKSPVNKKTKLSAVQKLSAALADFFDLAHLK
jgi:phage gp29-like protein